MELEKKLLSFIDQSKDLVIIVNKDLETVYANKSVYKLLGSNKAELMQRGAVSFIHPDDTPKFQRALALILQNPLQSFVEKLRVISKSGKIYLIDLSAHFDEKESIIFWQGRVCEDGQSNDSIFGEAKKLAKVGIWEYFVEKNEVRFDDEMYNIYELATTTEMTLDRMKQFFRKEALEIFNHRMKELVNNGVNFDEELSFISGQFRPSTARFMAKIEKNRETRIIGTIQDLTDVRRIERRASDYREAVDKSSIVSITDRYGIITEVNDKFCQITKYSREELIGKNYALLNSKTHSDDFWKDMWEIISKGEVWHGEIKNKSKDGRYYWVDTTIIPFKNSIGRIFQYLAIQRDFTENKRLGEELMVSEKLSSIGEISAQILHEVMTPLSIISLSIESLEDNIEDLKVEERLLLPTKTNLNEIKMNYEKIEEIFENMRSILVRKNQGESVDVFIKKTITKTLSLVNAKLKSRNITVQFENIPPDLSIYCTETDLSQIFLNLINNAADAIEKLEDKWIDIKTEISDAMIKIEFQDSGKGIPEEIRHNMFDALYTTKGEGRGTGLGMGVVKKLIERHMGKIQINADSPNTTFILTFPFRKK